MTKISISAKLPSAVAAARVAHNGGWGSALCLRRGESLLFPKPFSKFFVLVSTLCSSASEALLQQHGFSCSPNSYSELFRLVPKP